MFRVNCLYLFVLVVFCQVKVYSQSQVSKPASTTPYIQTIFSQLYTADYLKFKQDLCKEYSGIQPGKFGITVNGVYTAFETKQKQIALTFDACVGAKEDYNEELINYLKRERIPATLFVSGLWIKKNPELVKDLAADPLFEIENHGLLHRVCSVNGKTAYGIKATKNVGEVIDEMELNARNIQLATGKRPRYFRPATANIDEASARIAQRLGMKVLHFDILSGDAIPFTPAKTISNNIIRNAHPGAIVIMHFNHPKWHEKEALEIAIPALRAMGYSFVKLENVKVVEKL